MSDLRELLDLHERYIETIVRMIVAPAQYKDAAREDVRAARETFEVALTAAVALRKATPQPRSFNLHVDDEEIIGDDRPTLLDRPLRRSESTGRMDAVVLCVCGHTKTLHSGGGRGCTFCECARYQEEPKR